MSTLPSSTPHRFYLTTNEDRVGYTYTTPYSHFNLAYFCPRCGNIWARAERMGNEMVAFARSPSITFITEYHICKPCGGDGSLLSYTHFQILDNYLSSISTAQLQYEFLIFSSSPDNYFFPGN